MKGGGGTHEDVRVWPVEEDVVVFFVKRPIGSVYEWGVEREIRATDVDGGSGKGRRRGQGRRSFVGRRGDETGPTDVTRSEETDRGNAVTRSCIWVREDKDGGCRLEKR